MYQVFDNGKPAEIAISVWEDSKFNTLEEAQNYAAQWLGKWNPDRKIELNEKYNYSGYGDVIEIREVD